jgi:hypothetical protein
MGFNKSAFIIASSAIAIAGVGLYLWDTRGKNLLSSSSQSYPNYGYNTNSSGDSYFGGKHSRKHRKSHGRKTKRH